LKLLVVVLHNEESFSVEIVVRGRVYRIFCDWLWRRVLGGLAKENLAILIDEVAGEIRKCLTWFKRMF